MDRNPWVELVETTPEHPFYVEGEGWTNAEDLRTGDKVRQADGTTGIVWLSWNVEKTVEMYHLTVDGAAAPRTRSFLRLLHSGNQDKRGRVPMPPRGQNGTSVRSLSIAVSICRICITNGSFQNDGAWLNPI